MSEKNTYIITGIGELLPADTCYAVNLTPKDRETFLSERAVRGRDLGAIIEKLGGTTITAILAGPTAAVSAAENTQETAATLVPRILSAAANVIDSGMSASVVKSALAEQNIKTTVKELDTIVTGLGWTVVGTGSSKVYRKPGTSEEE